MDVQIETKPTGLELLRKPFPDNQISKFCKPTKKDNQPGKCSACNGWHKLPSVQLSYVGHAALTDRLLDADPNWSWEPLAVNPQGTPLLDEYGGMWIRLTVCGITRLGYGDAQGKIGGDAMKERIGDALRNAAMRFGAALDLWHKGDLHADEEVEDKPAPKKETRKATKSEVKVEAKKEESTPQSASAAQSPTNDHGVAITDDDVPNVISSQPDAEEYRKFVARLKVITTKASNNDAVKKFIGTIVGDGFKTQTLTKVQWEQSLSKLEAADSEGKLKELINV